MQGLAPDTRLPYVVGELQEAYAYRLKGLAGAEKVPSEHRSASNESFMHCVFPASDAKARPKFLPRSLFPSRPRIAEPFSTPSHNWAPSLFIQGKSRRSMAYTPTKSFNIST